MINDISNYEYHEDDFEYAHTSDTQLIDENYVATSYLKDVWGNFKKNKGAIIGAVIIAVITFMAIIGPSLNEHTYMSIIIEHAGVTPRIPGLEKLGIFNGLNSKGKFMYENFKDVYYWFGADTLGRDIFTRVWSGTRVSLIIAFSAVCIDIFIGMVYGMLSGYFGGKVDMFMQRFAEVLNGIPTLVVVTLLGLILKPGIKSIIFALMITGWISMERIARAQVLKVKEQEYVLAAKTLGAKDMVIIFKEILPNIFGQVIVTSMFSIPNAIFTEAYLSFMGLGLPDPLASLGSLVSDGYKSLTSAPHIILYPVIVLALLMISFNLFADGLRDAFDPKMLNK